MTTREWANETATGVQAMIYYYQRIHASKLSCATSLLHQSIHQAHWHTDTLEMPLPCFCVAHHKNTPGVIVLK